MQIEYFVTDAFGDHFYNSCKVCAPTLEGLAAMPQQHYQRSQTLRDYAGVSCRRMSFSPWQIRRR